MYILTSELNMYLKLEIRVLCKEFLAFKKYLFIFFFLNKSDDYLYLYNSRL